MTTPTLLGERFRSPARTRSLRLGDLTVTHVPDGAVQLVPHGWFPDTTPETWTGERAAHLDATGNLVGSIGALLVERDGRALLIDSGVGPVDLPAVPGAPIGALRGGALVDGLVAAGVAPSRIEAIAVTHLHPDHVGWAAHTDPLTGRSPFPGAVHLFSEPEWEHRAHAEAEGVTRAALAALARRVRTVPEGEEIFPGVRLRLFPGHTAGHTAYEITGGGRRLIAFGDTLHSPGQFDHPEWRTAPDTDVTAAADSRRRLLAELAGPGVVGYGNHFADVPFGRVVTTARGPVWEPVDD
ncbi:MBL fold metallo-hydrolase [Streptomyces sp. RFCAC02]|uniref:MBL fold metallo-hydrolase n=1 Tax=Streptomyces sp. RFCAC02 TaxID=2499143 RepID=UPI00101ED8AB|nr:MBL fold metallo-hydrolase [Streptomyces sp. RFCAC02]